MKKVIIHPTDFSKCSMVAFDYSIQLAELFDCKLLLVHSIDEMKLEGYDQTGHTLLKRSKEIEKEAENELRKLVNSASEKGIKCNGQLYNGRLNSWLPEKIDEVKPFMVLMGTTGAGSFANKVFGSNTYSTIQSSSAPVLAVTKTTVFSQLDKIVYAMNLKKINQTALTFLNDFAIQMNALLHLVTVVDDNQQNDADQIIEKLRKILRTNDKQANIEVDILQDYNYITGISKFISENKPTMFSFVMTDKNFIEKILHGSLSELMIHHSKVPILVFPNKMKI